MFDKKRAVTISKNYVSGFAVIKPNFINQNRTLWKTF